MERLPLRTDYYWHQPMQIRALRHAVGWSRYDLGTLLGLHTQKVSRRGYGRKYGICKTVANWETAKTRPMHVFRIQLTRLAELYKAEYLVKLAEFQKEGVHTHWGEKL